MQSPVAASFGSPNEPVDCRNANRKEMGEYMISVESWPDSAVKLWTLAQRFQKFVLVGVVGLAVNQFGLMALHSVVGLSVSHCLAIRHFCVHDRHLHS